MFEPFRRADDSVPDGVGLGLAVARGLTEAQGGTVRAEETPGGGLTDARRAGGGLMRILLVEDDRTLLRTLAIALRAEGHEVLTAADGRTALAAVAEDQPELVVLDLGLPDLSGMDVLRSVRGWSRLPVVVLSARSDSSDKVEALDAGADDYVTKPFGLEELLARIRAAHRRNAPDLPPVVAGDLLVDLDQRRVTRAGTQVHLTPKEWALLEVLVRAGGRVVAARGAAPRGVGAGVRARGQLPADLPRHPPQEARGRPRASAAPARPSPVSATGSSPTRR